MVIMDCVIGERVAIWLLGSHVVAEDKSARLSLGACPCLQTLGACQHDVSCGVPRFLKRNHLMHMLCCVCM